MPNDKMSNSKKKQEEKLTSVLRELSQLPENKRCFDCAQRGPTYLNMTIGSFVCTGCSGILRGLNPPHRVKSISMATFTPDEVEFVRNRGNEYCRRIWLGLYDGDPRTNETGYKDENQMKDHMITKYEKKRWYVSPTEVARQQELLEQAASRRSVSEKSFDSPHQDTSSGGGMSNSNSLIDASSPAKPKPVPHPQSFNSPPPSSAAKSKGGLVDLFDSDPFASKVVVPTQTVPAAASAGAFGISGAQRQPFPAVADSGFGGSGFANFDAFSDQLKPQSTSNAFIPKSQTVPLSLGGNQPQMSGAVMLPNSQQKAVPNGDVPHPPAPGVASSGGDKYKALAELDELFSSGPGTEHTSATPGSIYGATPMSSGYDSSIGGSSMSKSQSAFGGFGGGSGPAQSFASSANPFGSPNTSSAIGFHAGPNTGFNSSPIIPPTSNNANPFMAGTGAAPSAMNWGGAAMAAPGHHGAGTGGIRPNQQFPSGIPLQQQQQQSAMFGGVPSQNQWGMPMQPNMASAGMPMMHAGFGQQPPVMGNNPFGAAASATGRPSGNWNPFLN